MSAAFTQFTFTGLLVEDNCIFADEPQRRHVCSFEETEFTEDETRRIRCLFASAPAMHAALVAQEAAEQAFREWSDWSNREDVDPNEWGSINRALRAEVKEAEEKAKALRATALAQATETQQ